MTYLPFASNRKPVLAIICLALLLGTSAWSQQNLLTNPGFETGNFAGWTVRSASRNFGVNTAGFVITGTDPQFGTTTVLVHSGSYAGYTLSCASCYPPEYLDLSQTVSIVPGNIYTASLWMGNGSTQVLGIRPTVTVNSVPITLPVFPSQIGPGYSYIAGSFIATSATAAIKFRIEGSGTGAAGFSFDDLSLISQGPTSGNLLYEIDKPTSRIWPYQIITSTGILVPAVGSPFSTPQRPTAVLAKGALVYVSSASSSDVAAYTTNLITGTMTPVPGSPFPAGLGPVTVAVNPGFRYLYAAGLDPSNDGAIAGWAYNSTTGVLTPIPGSPFAAGSSPVSIAFSRNGRFAYVLDRRQSEVLSYSVNTATGALSQLASYSVGGGASVLLTQNLGNFLYVADAGTNEIYGFTIDGVSGDLTPVPGSPFAAGTGPNSLAMDAAQRYLYAGDSRATGISAYQINLTSGALSQIAGSPFSTNAPPTTIVNAGSYLYANEFQYGLGVFQINSSTGALTLVPNTPLPFGGTALATNVAGRP